MVQGRNEKVMPLVGEWQFTQYDNSDIGNIVRWQKGIWSQMFLKMFSLSHGHYVGYKGFAL